MVLPTDLEVGDPGHAQLHNDVNTVANAVDARTQDTGWRNVLSTALDEDFESGGSALLRRVGDRVTLRFRLMLKAGSAGGAHGSPKKLLTLPTGFSTPSPASVGVCYTGVGIGSVDPGFYGATKPAVYVPHGAGDWAAADVVAGEITWVTGDAWPVTLPGSPA